MVEKLQSILEAEGLTSHLSKFTDQGVTDSILGDLTDADLKDLGIEKLGERKRLLAAFLKTGGAAAAVSVVEDSATQSISAGASSSPSATPSAATKESPFINSLGIPFVPIPRFETRFAIWPVRVQDYEAYCMASGAKFPEINFPQESDHPIAGVTWNEAIEFSIWLTGKERAEGKIDEKTVYRLPTDLEWSAAVGLPHEPEPSPEKRHLKAPGYPWGLRWPPPQNAGNYERRREDQLGIRGFIEHFQPIMQGQQYIMSDIHRAQGVWILQEIEIKYEDWKKSWTPVDDFDFTSPVGSFAANQNGIYDLGGNVWEYCMDSISNANGKKSNVIRGNSYGNVEQWIDVPKSQHFRGSGIRLPEDKKLSCRSSYRSYVSTGSLSVSFELDRICDLSGDPIFTQHPDVGFRLCLATT